ncbi:MAG: mandelate racemase/muconate lactonizing enzyme family protein [Cyclobacteriaceae bacterium]|nr:mandelate racemase/muconate lactonizing enzyme family protein [Cyclobacteriaceae bacterium]
MKNTRRDFLTKSTMGATMLAGGLVSCTPNQKPQEETTDNNVAANYRLLDEAAAKPVLKADLFAEPLLIDTLELLRYEDNFLCIVRTTDGAEGISVSNNMQMVSLYPIFVNRLQPFFLGKDARNIEALIEEVYVYQSNYKLQNLALWVPLATIEFAILDLLGKLAQKSIGQLIGTIHHPAVSVYQANNFRGKSAAESIELIKRDVEETKAKALKFKVGGRMSNNADYPAGRSEELIPLVRKTFGDDMVIYADSNGSYTVDEAIRIGKLIEENRFDFYEEPVPFDWYEETRQVADALSVPIAGGEQEPSMHQFRWLLANNALQVVQPDIFYFGGMIRSVKVANMANALGTQCVPHISGSGLGYLYMMHFVSAIPNAGPYHEFKGFNSEIPFECPTSTLESVDGTVTVPTGSGLGIDIDPEYIARHKPVKA